MTTIPDPPPSHSRLFVVEIGPKEIYDQLVALTTEVRVLVGDMTDTSKKVDDHEARIRAVEKRQWPLPVVSVLVAIAAVILAAFPQVIK
ncbi:hypothetical protein [Micromonospora sp. NPDC004704]